MYPCSFNPNTHSYEVGGCSCDTKSILILHKLVPLSSLTLILTAMLVAVPVMPKVSLSFLSLYLCLFNPNTHSYEVGWCPSDAKSIHVICVEVNLEGCKVRWKLIKFKWKKTVTNCTKSRDIKMYSGEQNMYSRKEGKLKKRIRKNPNKYFSFLASSLKIYKQIKQHF